MYFFTVRSAWLIEIIENHTINVRGGAAAVVHFSPEHRRRIFVDIDFNKFEAAALNELGRAGKPDTSSYNTLRCRRGAALPDPQGAEELDSWQQLAGRFSAKCPAPPRYRAACRYHECRYSG
jgi:hypothetical protein